MSPRARLVAAVTGLVVIGTLAGLLGRRRNVEPDLDPRRSTYLAGPYGARGYFEALARLGVEVRRSRERPHLLDTLPTDTAATLRAVLAPAQPLDVTEAGRLLAYGRGAGDLLLAGETTEAAMRCLGYRVEVLRFDSLRAVVPGSAPASTTPAPWVHAVLAATDTAVVVDSSGVESGRIVECVVPERISADTLLVAEDGRPVALELTVAPGRRVALVADDMLFSNRVLRATDAGVFALGLAAGRYDRVVFDEYRHGFSASGNLTGRIVAWSLASPWGWVVWQLGAVGVLALLAGGVRFGPPRAVIDRRRRSPLEHVRALATALAAARGHDVAVRLQVQGLRRRLSRSGQSPRGAPDAWLATLPDAVRSPAARTAALSLHRMIRHPQPADGVLQAAQAVEDVWQDLKP